MESTDGEEDNLGYSIGGGGYSISTNGDEDTYGYNLSEAPTSSFGLPLHPSILVASGLHEDEERPPPPRDTDSKADMSVDADTEDDVSTLGGTLGGSTLGGSTTAAIRDIPTESSIYNEIEDPEEPNGSPYPTPWRYKSPDDDGDRPPIDIVSTQDTSAEVDDSDSGKGEGEGSLASEFNYRRLAYLACCILGPVLLATIVVLSVILSNMRQDDVDNSIEKSIGGDVTALPTVDLERAVDNISSSVPGFSMTSFPSPPPSSSFPATSEPLTPTPSLSTLDTADPTEKITALPITTPPTEQPSENPVTVPTRAPTRSPTEEPTSEPTRAPTRPPVSEPTSSPTRAPTQAPTPSPTQAPVQAPVFPTMLPTNRPPVAAPTKTPTRGPTGAPSPAPTKSPTNRPTQAPNPAPTKIPTNRPTQAPVLPPVALTAQPSIQPTLPPNPNARFISWSELLAQPDDFYTRAVKLLGYTEETWNNPHPKEAPNSLSFQQVRAAGDFGDYALASMGATTSSSWNCWVNHYWFVSWDDMDRVPGPEDGEVLFNLLDEPTEFGRRIRAAYEVLGWSERRWVPNESLWPESEFKAWVELAPEEREAAKQACWTKETWDEDIIPRWE